MSLLLALRRPPVALRCLCRQYASDRASSSSPSQPTTKPVAGATPVPRSTCSADTILPGVNYLKDQPAVVALADEEYPEWLWTILQPKVIPDDGPGGKLERSLRRTANRKAIKDRNFMLTQ
ncbi:mitochondrial ribosomal protein L37-domain-containing protein [Crassisporium funariophilum]|nr:mitochondrial ribosomal protein L37-domain-containing protein [Crassisporium funariophilum]